MALIAKRLKIAKNRWVLIPPIPLPQSKYLSIESSNTFTIFKREPFLVIQTAFEIYTDILILNNFWAITRLI